MRGEGEHMGLRHGQHPPARPLTSARSALQVTLSLHQAGRGTLEDEQEQTEIIKP